MKPYKARIQHSCGYPEEQLKDSHILTPDEVFSPARNHFHNFTVRQYTDKHGLSHCFECERALTRYRITVNILGETHCFVAKRNSNHFKTSGILDGHKRMLQGCTFNA